MRKIIIALLWLPVIGWSQSKDNFEITGNIKGLKDSTMVFLMNGFDGKTLTTAKAFQGAFVLKGTLPAPDIFQIGFVGYKEVMDLFLQHGMVTVTGDITDIGNAVVKGDAIQHDYELFKQRFNPLKNKLNSLAALINQETDAAKRNQMIQEFGQYKSSVVKEADTFIKQKPGSPVSSFVLFVISPLVEDINDLEAKYRQLLPAAKASNYAKLIEKNIADAKVGAIGTQAIAFTQKDTANKPVSLSSFKGKYVLVDFWASWCRPCRAENPHVVEAFNQYKDKNFTVLGVSLDQDRNNWIQAIKADKLTWTHVSDLKYWNNAVAQLYHIQSIPANMLIDPDGKIIARDLREDALHKKLQELLK
ncbi:MAG: TlpA disulfide reductase family protein [Sediminibacterium sp.]